MIVWINADRNLRYREHKTRRHGQRPDRFWSLHYTVSKRSHNEGVGWWSQGVTQAACRELLAELQRNWRTGAGPQTLKELREAELARKAVSAEAEAASRKTAPTLGEFWSETALPQFRLTGSKQLVELYVYQMRSWLRPLLDYSLAAVTITDLENLVVKPMLETKRSPSTIESVLRLFSVLWHRAKKLKLVGGDCPVAQVKRPRADNRRDRFLSPDEAGRLLAALKERAIDVHDVALMSLFTGLRAGECMALTWPDIDFENGLIFVKDPKNRENRHAFMTAELRAMLMRRRASRPKAVKVFQGPKNGLTRAALTGPFRETVKSLGFNEGIADTRQQVCFHSLRQSMQQF